MSHRAEQIVEAMQTIIAAFSGLAINPKNVHIHRTLTLSEDVGELDAMTINLGDDSPVSEFGTDNVAFIDSILSVPIVSYAKATTEYELRRALSRLRRQMHQALMADVTLGLSFMVHTMYGGAKAVEIETDGDSPVGQQESLWRVHYRMNITDPGDA
jgi:hypothetical protein